MSTRPKRSTAAVISAAAGPSSLTSPRTVRHLAARLGEGAGRRFERRGVDVADHHPRALLDEDLRTGAPDAIGAPRHDRDLILHAAHGARASYRPPVTGRVWPVM
jgi:predicted nuclease with RNAse H fold